MFLLFEAPKLVLLCACSPRTLIRPHFPSHHRQGGTGPAVPVELKTADQLLGSLPAPAVGLAARPDLRMRIFSLPPFFYFLVFVVKLLAFALLILESF